MVNNYTHYNLIIFYEDTNILCLVFMMICKHRMFGIEFLYNILNVFLFHCEQGNCIYNYSARSTEVHTNGLVDGEFKKNTYNCIYA